MTTLSSVQGLAEDLSRRSLRLFKEYYQIIRINEHDSANLATSGYSVFLIEAGGDSTSEFVEEIPSL